MHKTTREPGVAGSPAPIFSFANNQRASSRMLETYLADIERLAHSEQRSAALRTALALPHIAAALCDAYLQTSEDRYKEWCSQWVTGVAGYELTANMTPAALFDAWKKNGSDFDDSGAVPEEALRQLRLRRLARAAPVYASWVKPEENAPEAAREFELCTRIVEGMRRWYGRQGLRDAVVQNNLARLAVLR